MRVFIVPNFPRATFHDTYMAVGMSLSLPTNWFFKSHLFSYFSLTRRKMRRRMGEGRGERGGRRKKQEEQGRRKNEERRRKRKKKAAFLAPPCPWSFCPIIVFSEKHPERVSQSSWFCFLTSLVRVTNDFLQPSSLLQSHFSGPLSSYLYT